MPIRNQTRGPRAVRALTVLLAVVLAAGVGITGCQTKAEQVVVYTSVDQAYARPVFAEFERRTAIKVVPVYEIDPARSDGLAQRLVAEHARPQADVYWSADPLQTVKLVSENVFEPYRPLTSSRGDMGFSDRRAEWSGIGGRGRVILMNTKLTEERPSAIWDLLDERWPADRVGLVTPLSGGASMHAAALYAADGPEGGFDFFRQAKERGVRFFESDAALRNAVASGEILWGLVGSEEAVQAVRRGAPVRIVIPDQGFNGKGVLVVPNTVAVVKGGPDPRNAHALVEFLTSSGCEESLVKAGLIHLPLHGSPPDAVASDTPRPMKVDLRSVYAMQGRALAELSTLFAR